MQFVKQILIIATIIQHYYCQHLYFHLEKEGSSFTDDVQAIFNETTHSQTSCFMGCLNHQHCCYAQLHKESLGEWFCSLFTFIETESFSTAPDSESNIFSVVDEKKKNCVPRSCLEWQQLGYKYDGVYTISINGKLKKVSCDMSTNGGGWTIIQRRIDGSVDFERNWDEYKHGFGDVLGEYWLGNDLINQLTDETTNTLIRIDGTSFQDIRNFIISKGFWVENEDNKYMLHTGKFEEGDSVLGIDWSAHNLKYFSTIDEDNDSSDADNCAIICGGSGWWYKSCFRLHPNNKYYDTEECDFRKGISWYRWTDFDKSLKNIKMSIKKATD